MSVLPHAASGRLVAVALVALSTAGVALLLGAESQGAIAGVLVALTGLVAAVQTTTAGHRLLGTLRGRSDLVDGAALAGALVLIALFRDDHYAMLMVATVLFFSTASLGLNLQAAFAGVANFAGAAFFSVGAYTAALLINAGITPIPVVLAAGGITSALLGLVLLLPVLRTKGHYAALVTIGFGVLLRSFLEVNDALGGPQGIKIPGFDWLGVAFNDVREIAGVEVSFYLPYALLALLLFAASTLVLRLLENSWIGVALDAVRSDETSASVFGLSIGRWKGAGFVLGNVLIGMGGAGYGVMNGFVNPNGAGLPESLIMISIIVLGGIGNVWGAVIAAIVILVVPEKLQAIQEYKLLIFACLVLAIILFRPAGILPRPLRDLSRFARTRHA